MKPNVLWLALLIFSLAVARGQEPPQNRHGIGHGKNYKQASEVYIARTPYILEWHAAEKYNLYDQDPTIKAKDEGTSIQVFDAETGKMILNTPTGGFTGRVSVPSSGKHYVIVYSLGEWNANYIEDLELLKKAQRAGTLTKDGVVTPESLADAQAARHESVESSAAASIDELKKTLTGRDLEEKTAGVRLVASGSNS